MFFPFQDPNSPGGETGPQAFTPLQCAADNGHLEVRFPGSKKITGFLAISWQIEECDVR